MKTYRRTEETNGVEPRWPGVFPVPGLGFGPARSHSPFGRQAELLLIGARDTGSRTLPGSTSDVGGPPGESLSAPAPSRSVDQRGHGSRPRALTFRELRLLVAFSAFRRKFSARFPMPRPCKDRHPIRPIEPLARLGRSSSSSFDASLLALAFSFDMRNPVCSINRVHQITSCFKRATGLCCGPLGNFARRAGTEDRAMRHLDGCWQSTLGLAAMSGYAPHPTPCALVSSAIWPQAAAPWSEMELQRDTCPAFCAPQVGVPPGDSKNLRFCSKRTEIENLPKRSARFSSVVNGHGRVRAKATCPLANRSGASRRSRQLRMK
jgi:hypothetical protein